MGLGLQPFVVRVYSDDCELLLKNTAVHFPSSEAFLVCALYTNARSS